MAEDLVNKKPPTLRVAIERFPIREIITALLLEWLLIRGSFLKVLFNQPPL
jgi:hypothetical protein